MSDFARSVQILIELVGNPEQRLTEINRLTDQLNHKKIGLNDAVSGLAGGANNAAGALGKVASSTQDVASKASDLSGKSVSAFGKIKESVLDLNNGVQTLAASLAGIAMGGAISGLAWKTSADLKLMNEQIDKAINANKKLGISSTEFDEFVKGQVEAGEGTRQDTKQELYSVLMAGGKYFRGSSAEKLEQADAITDFWFSQQELMKAQGISSPEQLILQNVRTEGKMSGRFGEKLAMAMGVDANSTDFASAKNRIKYMIEQGGPIDMKVEMDKRPWEDLLVSVNTLKYAIGDGLAPVMSVFIKMLTGAVKLLNSIPGAAPLIGLAGGAIALVSTLTLLNGVLMPGLALLKQMVVWTNLHTVAEIEQLVVSKALIVTDWLGVTSKAARSSANVAATATTVGLTGATVGLTGATTALAVAEWAALSPLLLLAVPLIAVAGLLYLAETRTHVFSNALDKLSKTEMNKDLIKWLEDVGYWAGYAVDKLGSVMGAGIETGIISPIVSPIEGLDSLYKSAKSGGIPNVLGLGGEESENNSILLTTKLFQPISAISGHISTIDEVTSWIKGLLGTGWNAINGIYSGIVNFPQNAYKFVVDGIIGFGKWIYNGIVYWATWIYNGILYWAGEVRNAFDSVMKDLGIDDQIDKFKTFIDDVRTSIGDLVSDFNTLVSGLTDKFNTLVDDIKITITGLIDKFTTFVSDIKTTISNLIPGWMKGSDSGNAGSEEGFIEFIRNAKKGSENYDKYAQLSDEALRAAYREGLTGVPQDRPNMTDPYEYDNIVKYAVPEYTKSIQNNTTFNTTNNIDPLGDLGAAVDKTLQDDIAKIKEKVDSGEPISSLTPDLGNPSGLIKIAYTGLDSASGGRISAAIDSGKEKLGSAIDSSKEALGSGWNALRDTVGFADGGFVEKTGFALVHSGEPIIPAEVANSSKLQTILENIAYGSETTTTSTINNEPIINIYYNVDPRAGIIMSESDFEKRIRKTVADALRQKNGY
ncbi:hypothetical protein [Methanosaeta sp. UBA356]|jgi:ABC-type transporter Mla subunit MlaD|uniref:hypothetical protein n=1 Tax=Methanosaeta sp. UBA356 TaxID=1915559 RepID=UPI00257F2542|nr:hypothetical protein [Methanosaeta sp. UBA356]